MEGDLPLHPHDARQLAWELLRRHGLEALGWRFRFDNARRRFGSCRFQEKLITLSRTLTLLNPEDQVCDTLLHEIAHALTPGDGHGAAWKSKCAEIGAEPRRCYDEVAVVSPPRKAAPYRYGCRPCGWWVERRRIVSGNYVCSRCRGPVLYEVKATGRCFRVRVVREGRRRLRICEPLPGEMLNAE
jgi:predicted SprT family Zn-dependent metalloprotease